MEVWTWILILMVLVATGLFVWWLIVSISEPMCYTCTENTGNHIPNLDIDTNRSTFSDLYKDFYHGLSNFSVDNTDNNMEILNSTIVNLSTIVCPSKYDSLKLLYDQNVTLLTHPLSDLSKEDVVKRGEKLNDMAREMTEVYSTCISVDIPGLNRFFALFNKLMLVKINAKDDIIKGKLDTNILALLERLNFSQNP
jgi:hypothetical protein